MNKNIPIRSKQCMPDVLDLSDRYNFSFGEKDAFEKQARLSQMPAALKCYADAAYDARGIIQLAKDAESANKIPESVNQIVIGAVCSKIHFLHGTIGIVDEGTIIGAYTFHYVNGKSVDIPMIYGNNIKDIAYKKGDMLPVSASVGWHDKVMDPDQSYEQVYSFTVNSPLKDIAIIEIDIKSYMKGSAPFVLAMTAQKAEPVYVGFFDGSHPINTIYPRDPWAGENLIDLSRYFTASLDDDWHMHEGHDLQNVPKGLQNFKGVTFDVRGVVQLAAGNISLRRTGAVYPESVEDIRIDRKAKMIHFLHSSGWGTENGTKVGAYIINYEDGQAEEIPLVYGENIADWWLNHSTDYDENTKIAWVGTNSYCHNMGVDVHLIQFSWKNPDPEKRIKSFDFVSALETAGPFLVAVTVEN